MIKLQHMTIIFVIVMIPLVLVLSYYISIQIDTMNLQTQYNTKLNDATHDAMEAFQINTSNNEYSTVADSLKRDVAAAINTFYTSLASNMGVSGTAREELQPYIPAVLCTMYDGYYISSPTRQESGQDLEEVLKQYTYYTARYIGTEYDLVINYSLDNYISIYGNIGSNYIATAGYWIDTRKITEINGIPVTSTSYTGAYDYNENTLILKQGSSNIQNTDITSIVYNGQTIGVENGVVTRNNTRQYITDPSRDALDYYIEAFKFSKYIDSINLREKINGATQIQINKENLLGEITAPNLQSDEDPENLQSGFVNHKRDIIRWNIEKNLQSAFNNFEGVSTYDYQLPKLTEEDWEKIYKNVSIVTFMQGIQVGSKIYNNYSVVTSTGNDEYVDPEEIYFVNEDDDAEYHRLGCTDTNIYNNIKDHSDNWTGYRSNMFMQQIKIIARAGNGGETYNRKSYNEGEDIDKTKSGYILKEIGEKNRITEHYHCMINTKYNSIYNENGEILGNRTGWTWTDGHKAAYYKALARERYCLQKTRATNIILNSHR